MNKYIYVYIRGTLEKHLARGFCSGGCSLGVLGPVKVADNYREFVTSPSDLRSVWLA